MHYHSMQAITRYAHKSSLQQMGVGEADQHGITRFGSTTTARHCVHKLAAEKRILNTLC